jgi:hypothetical protein
MISQIFIGTLLSLKAEVYTAEDEILIIAE